MLSQKTFQPGRLRKKSFQKEDDTGSSGLFEGPDFNFLEKKEKKNTLLPMFTRKKTNDLLEGDKEHSPTVNKKKQKDMMDIVSERDEDDETIRTDESMRSLDCEEDEDDGRKVVLMTDDNGIQMDLDLQEVEVLEYILGMLDLITTGDDHEDLANAELLAENFQ